MPTPLPHQIVGAQFLASRQNALLADFPRVGKTGAVIMACDFVMARRVLVVTTASGRANFGREFADWQSFPRAVQVVNGAADQIAQGTEVLVVGWAALADRKMYARLVAWKHDVLVLDESHYAKSPDAKRTRAAMLLATAAPRCWCLSGTPIPNAPNDLWPLLSVMAPERIDNMSYDAFVRRYCVVRHKFISGKRIDVVMAGKNTEELRARLEGFWLRRTQEDVGIREPIYSLISLPNDPKHTDKLLLAELDDKERWILNSVVEGSTVVDEIGVSSIVRMTGKIKAPLVAELVSEELANGLDRVVLMCWHTSVIDDLAARLALHGVAVLDGRTPPAKRAAAVARFQSGKARVFIGQITAAGEAIDLSVSCNLIFVEASFVPKDMRQAALRITNHSQKRQCLVRFAALAGSIDEALTAVLTRKVATIREVMR